MSPTSFGSPKSSGSSTPSESSGSGSSGSSKSSGSGGSGSGSGSGGSGSGSGSSSGSQGPCACVQIVLIPLGATSPRCFQVQKDNANGYADDDLYLYFNGTEWVMNVAGESYTGAPPVTGPCPYGLFSFPGASSISVGPCTGCPSSSSSSFGTTSSGTSSSGSSSGSAHTPSTSW